MARDCKKDLEICSKATPGPWDWNDRGDVVSLSNKHVDSVIITTEYYDGPQIAINEENDKFIRTSREALPYYINRCVELEAQVGQMRNILKNACKECIENFGDCDIDENNTCDINKVFQALDPDYEKLGEIIELALIKHANR